MRERALPFGYFRGIVGGADHWRAEVLNVSGNDALQAAYRGCKRRSNYWTRSDTVACLDYASLLALKWCPAGRRILAGVDQGSDLSPCWEHHNYFQK
jgi:hypothetical protein